MIEKFERLVAAGIEIVPAPEITTHFIFRREAFAALVERRGETFGAIGAAGMLTSRGLAPLVQRGARSLFVLKDFEQEASEAEADALRAFSRDLANALR